MARNVIAPEKDLAPVKEVFNAAAWNYEESLGRMRPALQRWRGATLAVCRELYYAKKTLTGQAGQRKDPGADNYIEHTWKGYCEALEMSPGAASRMARLYIPADESETGGETFLEAPPKPALPPPPAYTGRERERRIALVMNGGKRPADWTKEEERTAEEMLRARRAEELMTVYVEKKYDRAPRRDYLKDILAKTKLLKQFRLNTAEQIRAQFTMFDAIDGYFRMFPDKESLLAAAANLTAQIHDAVNYLVERRLAEESGAGE
jgi:hypothetical protein